MVLRHFISVRCLSRSATLLCMSLWLSACGSITSTRTVTVDSGQTWAVLPIENLSTTPMAGHTVATLLETQLRRRGVNRLEIYPEDKPETLAALLDGRARSLKAGNWALSGGFRYAVTGTVSEWHYKSGTDKEPAVGVNLKLIDVPTGDVLWQANAARTGWGYANLSRVGGRLVADMVDELRIRQQSINNTVATANTPSFPSFSASEPANRTNVVEEYSIDTTQAASGQGSLEISIPGLGAALDEPSNSAGDSIEVLEAVGSENTDQVLPSGRLRVPGATYSSTSIPSPEASTHPIGETFTPGKDPGN